MKTILSIPSVLIGMVLALLALVAGSGTILSFFTESHPLTMPIGEFGVTSVTLNGKILGAAMCALLSFLSYVFLIFVPDKIHAHRKG